MMHKKITVLFILFIILFGRQSLAQKEKPDYRKLHYLSEEEMHREFDASRDFYVTDPPEDPVRNVAEFEQMQSVVISYPLGIPVSLVKEMANDCRVLTLVANSSQQQTALNYYQNNNVDIDNCDFLIAPTDSWWTRDYGPWFVFDGSNQPGIVNFPYNRPRPNDNDVPIKIAQYLGIDLYGMNLETTGGNYMCDGRGKAASTDLIWEENSQYSHNDIDNLVENYLGIENYFVTLDPLHEYIKHIDCWGKFLSPGKVLIGQVSESDYRYEDYEAVADYFANRTSSYGVPYEVYRVFSPGQSQNTPYTNSLILNKKVLVPITGSQWDDEALQVYENAMPGYEVVGIYSNQWFNTDALHCRTKGVADIGMLYFRHVPLLGEVPYEEQIEISTDLIAYSGEDIYTDSVFLIYKTAHESYDTVLMVYQEGNTWTGWISGFSVGDQVSYYLYAADVSGRHVSSPFIGMPDPFEFEVVGNPEYELVLKPDTVLFLEFDQMIDGVELRILNNMNIPVVIDYMNDYGTVFPWYIEQPPVFPYQIMEGDSLVLSVLCDLPVTMFGELLSDTIFIETPNNVYKELVMIDSDLLSMTEKTPTESFIAYPNPFTDGVTFEFSAGAATTYELTVFDITGRVVDKINGTVSADLGNITWHVGQNLRIGTYFYKLKIGEINKSGRLIYSR